MMTQKLGVVLVIISSHGSGHARSDARLHRDLPHLHAGVHRGHEVYHYSGGPEAAEEQGSHGWRNHVHHIRSGLQQLTILRD